MASRHLSDLLPEVATSATEALAECKSKGFLVTVTCTYRSPKEQQQEFLEGDSKAKAWQSYHQYRRALDIVVMRNGKPVWNPRTPQDWALWNEVGAIFEKHGFEWAKHWKGFPELAHFQITGGKHWKQLAAELGVVPGQVTNLPKGYE